MKLRSRISNIQSKKYIEKKKTRMVVSICLTIVSLVVWGFAVVRLSNIHALAIEEIVVEGADPILKSKIESAALQALEGKRFGLFSKGNAWFYSKQSVVSAVLAVSPQITDTEISLKSSFLQIKVNEKVPSALVCIGFPDLNTDFDEDESDSEAPCYFADEDGLLYAESPKFSGKVYNRYFVPSLSSSEDVEKPIIGSFATSTEIFTALQDFTKSMQDSHIEVEAILIKEDGEFEMFTHSGLGDKTLTIIYLNYARPLSEQGANLVSFWKEMSKQKSGTGAQGVPSFEYIDVRYGSHVYYRVI